MIQDVYWYFQWIYKISLAELKWKITMTGTQKGLTEKPVGICNIWSFHKEIVGYEIYINVHSQHTVIKHFRFSPSWLILRFLIQVTSHILMTLVLMVVQFGFKAIFSCIKVCYECSKLDKRIFYQSKNNFIFFFFKKTTDRQYSVCRSFVSGSECCNSRKVLIILGECMEDKEWS